MLQSQASIKLRSKCLIQTVLVPMGLSKMCKVWTRWEIPESII